MKKFETPVVDNREPIDFETVKATLLMAGVPHDQIEKAMRILKDFESGTKLPQLTIDSLREYSGFSDHVGGNRHERRMARALARKKS